MVDTPDEEDLMHSVSDNLSFHRANKAYYRDKNYEIAIREFKAAIEFERSRIGNNDSSMNHVEVSTESANEIVTKSMYWLAESYRKLNQIDRALESFEQLALRFSEHHLGRAAERQLAKIEKEINPEEHEKKARQRAEIKRRAKYRELERKRREAAQQREDRNKRERERALKARLEKERQLKRKRETQILHEKEKQDLLANLREYFEKDSLNAYRFYQDRCTSHISFKEYESERINAEKVRQEKEKSALLKDLRKCFEKNFLEADRFYQDQCASHISHKEYKDEKIKFVQSWAKNNDLKTDQEQAAAIGAVEGNVQVVARAGSGKTATLINRARFLQQHCGVSPDEMLLLAFNKKAAEEMRERLDRELGYSIPYVMTFHALANAIVYPEKILVDEFEGPQDQSRVLQTVINQHLRNPDCFEQMRSLMMTKFRDDWECIISDGHDRSPEEMLRYQRSLTRVGLDGRHVKSFGEKVIANFLFEHDIKYYYEWTFKWDGRHYKPDFTIFTGYNRGIIIEYFGLKGNPDYDAMSEEKRDYWRDKPGWRLLEYNPDHLTNYGVNNFYALLKRDLEAQSIPCNCLSDKEIWRRMEKRGAIYDFTAVVKGFIQRCRKRFLTPEQLSEKVNNHYCDSDIEKRFLKLAQRFYTFYLNHLLATGEEDFDGLMQKAVQFITAGNFEFQYRFCTGNHKQNRTCNLKQVRYVFIDEYQDFSELFHRLMQALQAQNPGVRFFCVGDDWQAIYGFAGADLHFFEHYSDIFADSRTLHVATNYRSARMIVDSGNALMKGWGKPALHHKAISGKVKIGDLDTFEPTDQEEKEHGIDSVTPAVLRLVNEAINDGKNVVLLSRKNNLPYYVNYKNQDESLIGTKISHFLKLIQRYLPEEYRKKVESSTVHKYKGLQNDVVIVLDAIASCYPLLHSNLIYTRIFGDNHEHVAKEERRLLYVALTRAVAGLYILTKSSNFSPFLEDMEKNIKLSKVKWSDYTPPADAPTILSG